MKGLASSFESHILTWNSATPSSDLPCMEMKVVSMAQRNR